MDRVLYCVSLLLEARESKPRKKSHHRGAFGSEETGIELNGTSLVWVKSGDLRKAPRGRYSGTSQVWVKSGVFSPCVVLPVSIGFISWSRIRKHSHALGVFNIHIQGGRKRGGGRGGMVFMRNIGQQHRNVSRFLIRLSTLLDSNGDPFAVSLKSLSSFNTRKRSW